MKKLYFLFVLLLSVSVQAQIVNIPDANFKARLLEASPTNNIAFNVSGPIKIDTNNDGEIQVSEALQVGGLAIGNSAIASLEGINSFINLTSLGCANNLLTSLDTSALELTGLTCYNNQISSLVLSTNATLTNIDFSNNLMTSFVAPYYLEHLACSNNLLTSLTFPSSQIRSISCSNNLLQTLDLQYKPYLLTLICYNNQLQSLDFTTLNFTSVNSMNYLSCSGNQIQTLDISKLNLLSGFECANNALTSLNIKNGKTHPIDFSGNPNLQYLCVDDNEIQTVEQLITEYGYTDCFANSYCTLDPGGIFYNIRGFVRLDSDGNGCNAADINFSTVNLSINNVTATANYATSGSFSGMYSYNIQSGSYNIAPVLEYPAYFNISPASANVSFPSQSSPYTQNFCITPNGTHPDLEIILLPITTANPGFDAVYKLVYKNNGNTTQSGSVGIVFDESVLDHVSSNPVAANQSLNNLSWSFSDLLPFETRTIELVFNINAPTEFPAVNSGDILEYTATINSLATDDTPADNTFVHHQNVVNSFDPNDKVCLEGTMVGTDIIGNYVHYMIRFENSGTSFAHDIIISDLIDASKFDLSTLIALSGSHPYIAKVTGNKAEFIFRNIFLSSNAPYNKGYVSFKIKTKPTLVLGDTFSNTASIYFDYNFPIVTEPAVTTIAVLNTKDFAFEDYFTVYPNPVKDVLQIQAKNDIAISSISIYNTLGQLILFVPNSGKLNATDVSQLKTGNYFVKINSDKGTSNTRFVKM